MNAERMEGWLDDFGGYRHTVNEGRIDRWFKQFAPADRDLAARLLDAVDFISGSQIVDAFRTALKSLEGWHVAAAKRRGKWRFVAFSASAGESGDTMLDRFRLANNLKAKVHDDLFINKSELVAAELEDDDTVVFVDDFSGTGKQATSSWPEIQELLPGNPRVFLILVAAANAAKKKIESETDLAVVPAIHLGARDGIFNDACKYFSTPEKRRLLEYCTRASRSAPQGYGACGFVIVFAHSCPNNSIPILHVSTQAWRGLFRRYD